MMKRRNGLGPDCPACDDDEEEVRANKGESIFTFHVDKWIKINKSSLECCNFFWDGLQFLRLLIRRDILTNHDACCTIKSKCWEIQDFTHKNREKIKMKESEFNVVHSQEFPLLHNYTVHNYTVPIPSYSSHCNKT